MARTVTVDEAQEKLQDLLVLVLAGNEVIITEHGKPVAHLVPVPVAPPRKKRVAGLDRGKSGRAKTLRNLYRTSSG
jgi:prevent-host-death family protein